VAVESVHVVPLWLPVPKQTVSLADSYVPWAFGGRGRTLERHGADRLLPASVTPRR